eukprot:scaffold461_cov321-Pavlova_lutheri.AAC.32
MEEGWKRRLRPLVGHQHIPLGCTSSIPCVKRSKAHRHRFRFPLQIPIDVPRGSPVSHRVELVTDVLRIGSVVEFVPELPPFRGPPSPGLSPPFNSGVPR